MRQASKRVPESAEKTVRDIRRATRRHHSAEEKIRIVLEGLRGEDSIAELCRKSACSTATALLSSSSRALGFPMTLKPRWPLAYPSRQQTGMPQILLK
jgi:transposase